MPTGGLFVLAPASHPNYLIETNPLFASYTGFLSSDYFLQRLSLDPNRTEKRLGDGFYEQRLVGEQITELTGRPYLYSASHEDDYRQLLDNAVRYAQTYQLTPGIALTATQMALVTDDLVWLEDRLVGGQHVLVPQLYLGSNSKARLEATGALVIAADINLSAGTLVNSGTLDAKQTLKLTANDVTNQNGILRGGAIQVVALNDLTSTGGQIRGDQVSLAAGNDLALNATQVTAQTALSAAAGRDLTLGTLTEHYAAGGQQGQGYDETWQSSGTIAHRTTLQSNGSVNLAAGRDLTSVGASVSAEGDGRLAAGRNVTLDAAEEQHQSHVEQHKSGTWNRSDTTVEHSDTTQTGSSVSVGGQLAVSAGGDVTVRGSTLIAQQDVAVAAGGNLTLDPVTNTQSDSYQHSESKTGFFSTGGVGVSFGKKTQEDQKNGSSVTQVGSLVGSVEGNVTLTAGQRYTQTASTVTAPGGDVAIAARQVDIGAAQNQASDNESYKTSFTGVTLSITSPVISAVQTAQQMQQAASQTSDPRMKALAAASTALATKNAYDAVQSGQGTNINGKDGQIRTGTDAEGKPISRDANAADKVGGINISLSFGSSQSESRSTQTSRTAVGSTVSAGGNVSIVASGAGKDSNLTVQGSEISAGNNLLLAADNPVQLLAA